MDLQRWKMKNLYDVVVVVLVSGLAAAILPKEWRSDVLIERDMELGGILLQCIHNCFSFLRYLQGHAWPQLAQHFY